MITLVLLLVMSAAILAICFWPHLDQPRDSEQPQGTRSEDEQDREERPEQADIRLAA